MIYFLKKTILKVIPWGNNIDDYFKKFKKSQTLIDTIILNLDDSKTEIEKVNAALENEKRNIWTMTAKIEEYIYITQDLDNKVSKYIENLKLSKPKKAKNMEEEILFYVRQHTKTLIKHLAVLYQGYMIINNIKKTNMELLRGLNEASSTTIFALRLSVILAQSLSKQKLIFNQINALSNATNGFIESNATMLQEQSIAILDNSINGGISLESLKVAFDSIENTNKEISRLKQNALVVIEKDIQQFQLLINRAKEEL